MLSQSRLRLLCAASLTLFSLGAIAQTVDNFLLQGINYRQIGPFRGGRASSVSGVVGRQNEFYMGTCGGGLWKTTDAGVNWAPVSDGYFKTGVVGAIAVSTRNPDFVVVGMGETDIRGNISHGDGVYISTNGGSTWKHSGLTSTQTISRVRIDPTDDKTIFIAALGAIYGPTKDRGVFKSTDGGSSWRKVLFESEKAGAIDLEFNPENHQIMYAATWEAWRTAYSLNSGGPGSKMWKSTDGGETWKDISRNQGLPKGVLGKMDITISPSNPKRMWAIIEAEDGGIFRSDDGGDTWTKTNTDRNYRQRAWYFTHIFADPKDANTVTVLNVGVGKSTDGGTRFRGMGSTHSDHHDLWIDPSDPQRMVIANDGGASVSVDGGKTWTEEDYPTAQFYHVNTDNAFPYNILGAQQDNSTVRIASRTRGRGITKDDWTGTAGGESGYVAAKPDNPDIVLGGNYGGDLSWMNHRTNISRDISPWPDNPMGHGAEDLKQRFQWTFPIVFSPHDPNTVYTSSQHLFRSKSLGKSWEMISPDLTKNDKSKQGSSGGPITKDNTSVEYYCTIFTVAESPVEKGVIWTGSDDGLIYVSRNDGKSWTKVTPSGMPEWGLVSMIEASPTKKGAAWAAIDNHENNDYRPYIYYTEDYGKSWTRLDKGIPQDTFVRCVREDSVNPNLVFASTEQGVVVSFDAGRNWQSLQLNLPVVPVHDLTIKDGDLILATHGRSFWALDDISYLRQVAAAKVNQPFLFVSGKAERLRWGGQPGEGELAGSNPPSGLVINYYLPGASENVEVSILDWDGKQFMNLTGTGRMGLNRITTMLQRPSYKSTPGFIFWGAFPQPIPMPPGTYTMVLKVDGKPYSQKFRWNRDPRVDSTDAEFMEGYKTAVRIAELTEQTNAAVIRSREVRTQIAEKISSKPELAKAGNELMSQLQAVEDELHQSKIQSGQDPLNYPIKLNNKIAALLGSFTGEYAPTKQAYQVFDDLSKQIGVQLDRLNRLYKVQLVEFNEKVRSAGLEPVKVLE